MSVSKLVNAVTPLEQIAKINEIIDNIGAGITIDSTLSTTSTYPVQNKVITSALQEKSTITFVDWTPDAQNSQENS